MTSADRAKAIEHIEQVGTGYQSNDMNQSVKDDLWHIKQALSLLVDMASNRKDQKDK